MPSRRELFRNQGLMGETLDDTPIEVPGEAPLPLRLEMQRFIRQHASQVAAQNDLGDFESEDDFTEDVSLHDMISAYTVVEMDPEEGFARNDLEGAPTQEDRHPKGNEPSLDVPRGTTDPDAARHAIVEAKALLQAAGLFPADQNTPSDGAGDEIRPPRP